jgi:hypothetical protein
MFSMDVPLEAVADQLGHASIGVTKGVYVHLLPGSRAKAAKAMEELLYKDFVPVTTPRPGHVARPLARQGLAKVNKGPLTRDVVGRPGLDPGTLGLKEGCIGSDWSGGVGIIRESKKIRPVVSDSSGGVGMVCGMKCGICDRSRLFSMRVHLGSTLHSEPSGSCRLTAPISEWRLRASPRVGRSRARPASGR